MAKLPATPDYLGIARMEGQQAMDLAKYNTQVNRPTQIGPYGTVRWAQDKNGNWTQNTTLSQPQQQILNANQSLDLNSAQTANQGLQNASGVLSHPTLDLNALPASAFNAGETGQDAIMRRLEPQIGRERGQLETQLRNQGLVPGTEAYNNAMTQQNERENDLLSQAALYGINAQQQARQQGLNEQQQAIYTPINAINSLASGGQVQMPTSGGFYNQAQVQPTDYLSAAQQTYNAGLNNYNAKQSQQNNMWNSVLRFIGV